MAAGKSASFPRDSGSASHSAKVVVDACVSGDANSLLAIFDALSDAVVVTDARLRPVFRNAAARRAFAADVAVPQWFGDDGSTLLADGLPHAVTARTGRPIDALLAYGSHLASARWFRVSSRTLSGSSAATRCVVTQFVDITDLKRSEVQLRDLANVDPLTHLPNRRALHEHLERTIAMARRKGNRAAIAYIDLDGFKPVNDDYGHEAGDRLLVEVASRIGAELRAGDVVGRLGGDEFCVILSDVSTAADVSLVLGRALKAINQPFRVSHDASVSVSASMGVGLYPTDSTDIGELLRIADKTMYLAKARGKNCVEFYDKDVDREVEALRDLLTAVAHGLEYDEFRLWFQPKVNLATGRVIGVEALVRWQHPELGLLYPDRFLGAIERSDLIIRLGDWVIDEALRCASAWHLLGLELQVSVNVATRQLAHPDFYDKLEVALQRYPTLPPNRLQIELIETGTQDEAEVLRVAVDRCRDIGVSCAIDDFGSGASSLSTFRYLPADTLKVDQTCVDAMLNNCEEYMMVRGIIAVADAFGMEVVAEGMETAEHGARLYAAGCHVVQGYGIAQPMPEIDVASWCAQFSPDPRWTAPIAPFSDSGDAPTEPAKRLVVG